MQQIRESEELDLPLEIRKVLVAVTDSDECSRALTWCMDNLYREGDEVHLLHVVPRMQRTSSFGRPPVDFLPQQEPVTHDQVVKKAESFIRERFLTKLQGLVPEPVVHIVKCEADTASIGNQVCRKAEEIDACSLVLSARSSSQLRRFFLGSLTNHCVHHCAVPVMVVH